MASKKKPRKAPEKNWIDELPPQDPNWRMRCAEGPTKSLVQLLIEGKLKSPGARHRAYDELKTLKRNKSPSRMVL